jgi:hypothetical protein
MRDLTDIKELFEHDELVHDFEFAKRLYDSEISAFIEYADDEELIWGDLA